MRCIPGLLFASFHWVARKLPALSLPELKVMAARPYGLSSCLRFVMVFWLMSLFSWAWLGDTAKASAVLLRQASASTAAQTRNELRAIVRPS